MTAKLWLTNVKKSLSGWMRTRRHRKRTLMVNRRKSKEYALLSLQSCTKLEELLKVCQVVCLVVCLEECLVACLVMLAMLKVVQGQQLKKSIKRVSLKICSFSTKIYWLLDKSKCLKLQFYMEQTKSALEIWTCVRRRIFVYMCYIVLSLLIYREKQKQQDNKSPVIDANIYLANHIIL